MNYSIIQKSQLEGANRLDTEYYQPEYLVAEEKIKRMSFSTLGELASTLTDYHANGSYSILKNKVQLSTEKNYALMVRSIDLQTNNYDDDVRYISKEAYEFLKKTKIYGDELIIDKIGNAGEVYLMPKLDRSVTLGMNLFLIRLSKELSPKFCYIFLNSRFGRKLIFRRVTGTTPLSIDKNSVRSIPIPLFSKKMQEIVDKSVEESFRKNIEAENLYKEAEKLLLEELGLKDFKPREDLSFVVNYSDVKKADRMDADYFQPKYAEILERIKNKNGKKLEDLASIKKGFEPGSEAYQEEGKLFIRVSSLSKNGIDNKDQKYLSDDLYQQLKADFEPKAGEILLTKDATPGVAFVIKENIEGIISGGILRLQLKKEIEPEYLALCINSIIGKMQAEKDCGGSIIIHWRPEQIKNVSIPILSKSTQRKIDDLVRKSHEARKKSKELLEEAKRKVEQMIEKGE